MCIFFFFLKGRLLKEKQSILSNKHEESRRKIDSVNVGGGVCLWPEMEKMRLSQPDIRNIAVSNVFLFIVVTASFYYLHGRFVCEIWVQGELWVQGFLLL